MEIYGRRVVIDMPFDAALIEVTAALTEQGFHVLSRCSVRDLLARATQDECRNYTILEIAVPSVVRDALREDLGIGALLPVSVAVFELGDGETAVAVAEPFGGLTTRPEWRRAAPRLAALGEDTCGRLAIALQSIVEDARAFKWVQAAVAAPATAAGQEDFRTQASTSSSAAKSSA